MREDKKHASPARSLAATQAQAAAFLERFSGQLDSEQRAVVADYADLSRRGPFERRAILLRHGIFKSGWVRNLGLFATV